MWVHRPIVTSHHVQTRETRTDVHRHTAVVPAPQQQSASPSSNAVDVRCWGHASYNWMWRDNLDEVERLTKMPAEVRGGEHRNFPSDDRRTATTAMCLKRRFIELHTAVGRTLRVLARREEMKDILFVVCTWLCAHHESCRHAWARD